MSKTENAEPLVPDSITEMPEKKSLDAVGSYKDGLAAQVIKEATPLIDKAWGAVTKDADLREDIFTKESKDLHQALAENNKQSNKIIDDTAATNDVIRQAMMKKIAEGKATFDDLKPYLDELSNNRDVMTETYEENQSATKRILSMEQQEASEARHNSLLPLGFIIACLSGIALGAGIHASLKK